MNKTIITYTILFIILVLIQVLICNHIILFHIAVPFVFIYFIIRLPIGISKILLYTLAFLLGFCIDIFSDTPGVNSLSCLILSLLKQPVFYAYIPRDDKTKYLIPSISSIGWQNYSKFLITICAIFCLTYFSIEFFDIAYLKQILLLTFGSSILTFIIIYGIDCLMGSGENKSSL